MTSWRAPVAVARALRPAVLAPATCAAQQPGPGPTAPHMPPRRAFHVGRRLLRPKDPYETLGVPRTASAADIKKAYYRLAKKLHPDSGGGTADANAERQFQDVQQAYEILSDPGKRERFDQFGFAGDEGGGGPGSGGRGDPFGGFARGGMGGMGMGGNPFGFDAEEIFEGFFRGAAGGGRTQSASDNVTTSVRLTFMEAAKGATKSVSYQATVNCRPCGGSGAKPGTKPRVCPGCNGTGQETIQAGFFTVQQPCRRCNGAGNIIIEKCQTCGGKGTVRETKTVDVEFPAGIDDGMTMRMPGLGNSGDFGKGNLFVKVSVEKSDVFRREGTDLYVDVPLTLEQAVLGATVQVPTIDGPVEVKLNGGTQPGDAQRLRNRGLKDVEKRATGHQFITFKVQIPSLLTPRQREAFERFIETMRSGQRGGSSEASGADGAGGRGGKAAASDDSSVADGTDAASGSTSGSTASGGASSGASGTKKSGLFKQVMDRLAGKDGDKSKDKDNDKDEPAKAQHG